MTEPIVLSADERPAMQVQTANPTPMHLIQMALETHANIDTLERLVDLQTKVMDREALARFNAAMNRAQSAMTQINTDMANKQTSSRYASYAAIDKKIRPIYSREGLALSFDTSDSPFPDHVRVMCYVSHSGGHTRTYHADMPNDGKGAKGGDVMTKTHASGAAMSYAMRYLVRLIFNLAIGEEDHDGNETVNEDEIERNTQYIQSARDAKELLKFFGEVYTPAYNAKPRKNAACRKYLETKESRQREIA